jgi:hypothetical protein
VNVEEVGQLLAVASVYDRRRPSAEVAMVWAGDLDDVDLAEAITAVREHYTTHPDVWVVPGHLRAIVRRHRRQRLDHSWTAEADALRHTDPDDVVAYLTRLRGARDAVVAGQLSEVPALPPGRYDATAAQIDRNRRGAERFRAAVSKPWPGEPEAVVPSGLNVLRTLTDGPNWSDPD